MEVGLAAHPPEREGGLKAVGEKVEEPSPGQHGVLARQREAGGPGRAMGWKRHLLVLHRARAGNAPCSSIMV